MDDFLTTLFGSIGAGSIIFLVVGTPILIVVAYTTRSKYVKRQIETGEDKRIILNFAATLFKQPENYNYAVGNYTKIENHYNSTTYYYYSYLLAFNQGEFHVVAFKSVDHKPVYRNILSFNYEEMQLKHKRRKKSLEIDLYYAGEKQHITVSDIVKGTNNDKSDTPFAIEQSREVQLLEQMIMQHEARSYQIQMNSNQQMKQF